jgi:predicted ATPase
MLLSLEFKIDFRCFKAGDKLEFSPGMNLLVGDQGTGKSTLLNLLSGSSVGLKREEIVKCKTSGKITTRYFDCEKDNPRVKALPENENFDFALVTRFHSHGQAIMPIIEYVEQVNDKTLFFIDEPDMAMSPKSILAIKKIFDKAIKNGHQFVVSCHNPLLMLAYGNVLDLETKQTLNANQYLESIVGKKFFAAPSKKK